MLCCAFCARYLADALAAEQHPENVAFGTVDKTRAGGTNDPYADLWVVIGKK